jgi:hypothetical protein
MALAQLIVNSVVALVAAGVVLYIANSFRLQTRIKLLEVRVEAYRKLFALTEITSPTRLGRGDSLSPEEAKALGKAIYDWYYENGNGLLNAQPDSTLAAITAAEVARRAAEKIVGRPSTPRGGSFSARIEKRRRSVRFGRASRFDSEGRAASSRKEWSARHR